MKSTVLSRDRHSNRDDGQRMRRVNPKLLQLIQMRDAWQQLISYATVTTNSACNINFSYSSHRHDLNGRLNHRLQTRRSGLLPRSPYEGSRWCLCHDASSTALHPLFSLFSDSCRRALSTKGAHSC